MARRHMPRSAGERLKQLRIENGITVEELGRVYAGGKGAGRVEEIEFSFCLNSRVVLCYRSAVEAIVLVRKWRIARENAARRSETEPTSGTDVL